jgi:hypothetical protein
MVKQLEGLFAELSATVYGLPLLVWACWSIAGTRHASASRVVDRALRYWRRQALSRKTL